MINILKEVCVGNYSEARRAILNQADRVELCDNLSEGGTTPSYGTIKQTLQLTPNIVVMIRPRGGDFHYSDDEFKIMQEDILACKSLKVPSVVFGILKATSIDMERMQ
jgi:copper homeostasis protein